MGSFPKAGLIVTGVATSAAASAAAPGFEIGDFRPRGQRPRLQFLKYPGDLYFTGYSAARWGWKAEIFVGFQVSGGVFRVYPRTMPTDCELLRRYAEHGDEAAFTEVVRRQTDLVHSVAWRVTGSAPLAQDVTQTVFLRLAREAARVGRLDSPLGWLHTQARHRALDAVRAEHRRQQREHEAFIMHPPPTAPDPHWEQFRLLMDEAMGRLGERDREAVLLRFFKGLSYEEVGRTLGLSANSAQKRVDRALEKLRGHCARRGVGLSPAGLATVMLNNSVQAAPAGLAAQAARLALAGAGPAAGGGAVLLSILMKLTTKTALTVAFILTIGTTLALRLLPPPAEPPILPSAPVPVPVEAAEATAEPPPAVPEAVPAAADPAPAAVPAPPTGFVAGPQADLQSAILTGIHFLETNDLANTLRTLDTTGMFNQKVKSGLGYTVEEMAASMRSLQPETDALLSQQLAQFRAIQNLTPIISGQRATYVLDPPVEGQSKVTFLKVNGYWYYGSGTEEDWTAAP